MSILYGLRVLLYITVSFIIGYSTVKIVPILTPLGGMVATGIIFFTALLIHELVAHRHQKEKFQNHQLYFSLQTKQLNKSLYTLQQSLIETVKKLNLPFPKLPFFEEITHLEHVLQKSESDPKNFIKLLELQIQVLYPLVQTIAAFNPSPEASFPGPTLSSTGFSPALPQNSQTVTSGPNFPRFSLGAQKTPTLSESTPNSTREPALVKSFDSANFPEKDPPNVIPFAQKMMSSFVSSDKKLNIHDSFSDSLSAQVSKKHVLEHITAALQNNNFEITTDKVFDLHSKKVILKRCFPFIKLSNDKHILYGQFIGWALEENLHFYIDHITLGNVLQMARDSHQQSPALQYLCGIHIRSLMNEDFVNTYIEFAQVYPELCSRVIFEIDYSHFNKLSLIEPLQQLTLKGFNFALFSAHLELPKEIITAIPFYYYLLDAHQVVHHLHNASSLTLIESVKSFLQNQNTEMIMLNVDHTEKIASVFLKSGIIYGQGSFFGIPSFTQSLR